MKQGYLKPNPFGIYCSPTSPRKGNVTGIVRDDNENVVGTATGIPDSRYGFTMETEFPEELKKLRHGGKKLFEIAHLAANGKTSPITVLQPAYSFARFSEAGNIILCAHPDMVPTYEGCWGAVPVGDQREIRGILTLGVLLSIDIIGSLSAPRRKFCGIKRLEKTWLKSPGSFFQDKYQWQDIDSSAIGEYLRSQ